MKVGRLFYGLAIIAYGIQQIVIHDFRPQIVAAYPEWAHSSVMFPFLTGVVMIICGLEVAGVTNIADINRKKIALYLGVYFFILILASHIPYLLFVYPHKLTHLGSWGDLLKGLAFSGSSFIVAASFDEEQSHLSNILADVGRVFFCTTIILFGCNHFAYDLSGMVPKWFWIRAFWSYFAGTALIGAGLSILFKIFMKPVALLLAVMLLLWVMFVHMPGAIANPSLDRGNLIVSAFDALMFSGTALLLSQKRFKRLSNR